MNLRSLLLLSVLSAFVLGGCNQSGGVVGGHIDEGGSCDNIFDHPLINITEVVDATTQEPLSEVRLTNIQVGGLILSDSASLATPHQRFYGITTVQDGLRCEIPCGFGMLEGNWRFVVEDQHFHPDTVQIHAAYGTVTAGCPVRYRDGISVTVELEPSG
jgi:hypothetical protein